MRYRQLTTEERYRIAAARRQGLHQAAIARELGRSRSTVCREIGRNSARYDDGYRACKAEERTRGRRSRSRRNRRVSREDWLVVVWLLREKWSPEQASGWLRTHGVVSISHETIYRHVWEDKRRGGDLHSHLRGARKKCRKRNGSYDSRGRLAGKRHISERPACVEHRRQLGHWEVDTVMGTGSRHCIVSAVERKSGFALIGKLKSRTTEELNRRLEMLIARYKNRFRTITVDNGTEFHSYENLEKATGTRFYFATPYHSWERGSGENLNGLIRQYLPRGKSMTALTQQQCDAIADRLNTRPRKRLRFQTPEECFNVD
jgi:transposase, IS30 family